MNSPLLRSRCRHFTIINSSLTPLASLVALIASMNFELLAPSARRAPLQAIAHDLPSSDMQAVAWHGGTRRRARDTSAGTCLEAQRQVGPRLMNTSSQLNMQEQPGRCTHAAFCRPGPGRARRRLRATMDGWAEIVSPIINLRRCADLCPSASAHLHMLFKAKPRTRCHR